MHEAYPGFPWSFRSITKRTTCRNSSIAAWPPARQTGRDFEIILVDDGSRDGSRDLICLAADNHPEVIAVLLNRNYGQHAAVFAGLEQSRGQIVVTLDADLQNPPEEIPKLVAEMDRGVDVVGTVRENRQDTFFRRSASALVNRIVQRTTGVMMHDYGCMLRAYRRSIVDAMLQCRERSTFIPILANSFAGSTAEIPVRHAPRAMGESKYSFWKLISLQFDLLTSMSTFPLRLLSFMGAVIAASGVGFGVLLLVLRFAYGAAWAARRRIHPFCRTLCLYRGAIYRPRPARRIHRPHLSRCPRQAPFFYSGNPRRGASAAEHHSERAELQLGEPHESCSPCLS